jgi:hypothetical protein
MEDVALLRGHCVHGRLSHVVLLAGRAVHASCSWQQQLPLTCDLVT